jgi:hypothetical protein
MNKLDDKQLLEEIRLRLDRSIAHLEPSVSERLHSMRRQAVAPAQDSADDHAHGLLLDVGQKLDDNEAVTPEIAARLDQIRQQAITSIKSTPPPVAEALLSRVRDSLVALFASHTMTIPARVFATACVLVTAASLFTVYSRPSGSLTPEAEIGLIASADDIELYENLDFYLWLAENGLQ